MGKPKSYQTISKFLPFDKVLVTVALGHFSDRGPLDPVEDNLVVLVSQCSQMCQLECQSPAQSSLNVRLWPRPATTWLTITAALPGDPSCLVLAV